MENRPVPRNPGALQADRNGAPKLWAVNVRDLGRQLTYCHACGARAIGRDWHRLSEWRPDAQGRCTSCGTPAAGVFEARPGDWGRKRLPVDIGWAPSPRFERSCGR